LFKAIAQTPGRIDDRGVVMMWAKKGADPLAGREGPVQVPGAALVLRSTKPDRSARLRDLLVHDRVAGPWAVSPVRARYLR
jgi:hypothetical protein